MMVIQRRLIDMSAPADTCAPHKFHRQSPASAIRPCLPPDRPTDRLSAVLTRRPRGARAQSRAGRLSGTALALTIIDI